MSATRRRWLVLLATYLVFACVVAFWPTPVDRSMRGVLDRVLVFAHAHGAPWLSYEVIQFSANIAFFVPIGIAITAITGRRWIAIAVGAGISTLFEVGQAIALPDRFASLADITANTIGAALGAFVLIAASRRRTRALSD